MKIPAGEQFHGFGLVLKGGDELPDDIVAKLPPDHPYRQAAKPVRAPDKPKE